MHSQTFVTEEERKDTIAECCTKFNKYLLSPRPKGSILNNLECYIVAKAARETVTHYTYEQLPASVCMRPGTDFYAWMEKSEPKLSFSTSLSDEKVSFLVMTVHAVARHQHRLDEKWYMRTMDTIAKLYLNDVEFSSEEAKKVKCASVFCEVVSILAMSRGLQYNYIANGFDIPDLPSLEEVEEFNHNNPGPFEPFDMMSFLSNVRRESEVSDYSPFYTHEEINKESPEWTGLDKSLQISFSKFLGRVIQPYICNFMAPFDAIEMLEVRYVLYVKEEEMNEFNTLPSKCEGVTRYQLETVAAAFTGAVDCGYCHGGHTGMRVFTDSRATEADKESVKALEDFGKCMAQRPLDMEEVKKTREEVIRVGGKGLMIEASGIIGSFALMTPVVDCTGRKEIPNAVEMIVQVLSSME